MGIAVIVGSGVLVLVTALVGVGTIFVFSSLSELPEFEQLIMPQIIAMVMIFVKDTFIMEIPH